MTYPGPDPYQRRPVDINAYAPPKRGKGALWFALAGVLVVGVVVAALVFHPAPPTTPSGAPSSSSTPTAQRLPGMPFTMPNSRDSGRWEVLAQSWEGDELTVRVRVSCDTGQISYAFMAFSNAGTDVYQPVTGAPDPEIGSGDLRAGQSIEGYLLIPMPRGASTLMLTTSGGRQMSALPITG